MRCSAWPPPPAWTMTAPCTGTPSGPSSRWRSSSRTRSILSRPSRRKDSLVAMTDAASPYLALRQAVRPAILAHRLLAGDQERAGKLAAECEDLLYLTRELLKAAGRARILAAVPGPRMLDESGSDRQAQLVEAYADAGLLWAKVVGSSLALAGELIERGDWEDVRALASLLAGAGEESAAAELRTQLGGAVSGTHRERRRASSQNMP